VARASERPPPGRPLSAACSVRVADLEIDSGPPGGARRGAGERLIELTAKEISHCFECFAMHPDVVLDRGPPHHGPHVWDDKPRSVHETCWKSARAAVLRRKIDDGYEPKLIHTIAWSGLPLGVRDGPTASVFNRCPAPSQTPHLLVRGRRLSLILSFLLGGGPLLRVIHWQLRESGSTTHCAPQAKSSSAPRRSSREMESGRTQHGTVMVRDRGAAHSRSQAVFCLEQRGNAG